MIAVVAVLAAVLLCSAATKFAVPGPASRAIAQLAQATAGRTVLMVRLFAIIEALVAVALLFDPTRQPGAVFAFVLGIGFGLVGLLGIATGSSVPCGCFGQPDGHPFGARNVAAGLGVAGLAALAYLTQGRLGSPARSDAVMLTTALAAVLFAAWLHRRLFQDLLRVGNSAERMNLTS